MKKVWEKPKLVVLVRSRPEETILQVCKVSGSEPTGPGITATACTQSDGVLFCEAGTPCSSVTAT